MGDMSDYTNDPPGSDEPLYGQGGKLRCRCCGEVGLHWMQPWDSRKWRLYDDKSVLHECPVKPLPEGEI